MDTVDMAVTDAMAAIAVVATAVGTTGIAILITDATIGAVAQETTGVERLSLNAFKF